MMSPVTYLESPYPIEEASLETSMYVDDKL